MPHTHQYDTRYKDSRVGEIQRDMETYEAQPVPEMEVITINNIELSTDETPQVEPEVDIRVNNPPTQREQTSQVGMADFQGWMMRVMMELKEDGKKSQAENQKKMEETMNKNTESINKNMESLKENQRDLNKNIESMKEDHRDLNKNIESMREDLNKKNRQYP